MEVARGNAKLSHGSDACVAGAECAVAQLSVLLGVPLIWTLVREYFRPFKVPTYRW